MTCPLEVGNFGFEFLYLPLKVLRCCFQRHVFRLLVEEVVGVQRHMLHESTVRRCQVGVGSVILRRGL